MVLTKNCPNNVPAKRADIYSAKCFYLKLPPFYKRFKKLGGIHKRGRLLQLEVSLESLTTVILVAQLLALLYASTRAL